MRDIDRINLQGGFLAALPAIFAAVTGIGESLMTINTLIKTIQGPPSIKPVTIPGILGMEEIDQSIVQQINEYQQELEKAYQMELELSKKQEELEQKIIQRQKLIQSISKLAPFIVIGAVILFVVLLRRGEK